jgi:hypothetical protein
VEEFVAALQAVQRDEGLRPTASKMRVHRRIDLDQPIAAQADAVWEEVTVLRSAATWISGPLGLLAAGHYAETTGVIGMSRPQLSCDRLLDMLNHFEDALYISIFDETIEQDIDPLPPPSHLTAVLELGIVQAFGDDGSAVRKGDAAIQFAQREAGRLQRRREARILWTFPDDVHDAFAAGWTAWQKEKRAAPNALNGLLKYAAMMALDSGFSVKERKSLWRDNMTNWLLSHMSGDATELGMLQLYRLMADSETAFAKELLSLLRSGIHGKEPLARYAKHALRALEGIQINSLAAS